MEAIVVGVSLDSMKSHRRFKEEHDLPFPLVADTERRVIRLYDVNWGLWTSRAQRVTYLIDKAGLIRDVFRHELAIVRHQDDVMEGLKRINQTPRQP
jgi:peroxiredoxin Q/BCP